MATGEDVAWLPRLLTVLAAILSLLAALAWGGLLGRGLGTAALVAALLCAGAAFVLRLRHPSPARWQRLYLGITVTLLAAALVTLLVDPPNVGDDPCDGADFGDDGFCGAPFSFMALVVLPATVLAMGFACVAISETPTPRM